MDYNNYCSAYCDTDNHLVSYFQCNESFFCCGLDNDKFCCQNNSNSNTIPKDISGCYADGYPYYTYLLLSITLTTIIVVVATMIGICIYYLIIFCKRSRTSAVRLEITDIPAHRPEDFDPMSPSAFFPPPYIGPDKDPPAYEEYMNQQFQNSSNVLDESPAYVLSNRSQQESVATTNANDNQLLINSITLSCLLFEDNYPITTENVTEEGSLNSLNISSHLQAENNMNSEDTPVYVLEQQGFVNTGFISENT